MSRKYHRRANSGLYVLLRWTNGRRRRMVWADVTSKRVEHIIGTIQDAREYAKKHNLAQFRIRLTNNV